MDAPTAEEVARIVGQEGPVVPNLQITRCFEPPFTQAQAAVLKAGRRREGRL